MIEIFKPGRVTAGDGRELEFTQDDLKAIAAAYDPALHEAPLVIGHPKADLPAHGWVKRVEFSDTDHRLKVEPNQVEAQFADMVKSGRFKKISASFYTPDSPRNPAKAGPDGKKPYYLRHVGFLGAMPPAISGLKSVSFNAGEEGVIEFGEAASASTEAEDALPISKEERMTVSPEEIAAREAALSKKELEFAEREKAVVTRETALSEREKTVEVAETRIRKAEYADFVESLVKAGKVLPTHKADLIEFMDAVNDVGTIEFSEGEKKVQKSALDFLKTFLSALPKQVDFSEHAGEDTNTDESPEGIAKRAVEFREAEIKAGRVCSFADAVEHVKGGK